ncbi:hypothetical protein WDJ51_06480 [Rathayibacter sp. YIM 133350]|uniref:hypothetical protein n=1 Tax=Rathayibacter sp. YIM 133350 TaxID=3131992 RepID=UPI00307F0D23
MATNAAGGEPVLELRIHGVQNMPPFEMLDLPREQAEFAMGDPLGSFWHPTASALESGRSVQELGEGSRGVVDPSEPPRGSVPDGIHREAYSWGGMVRTTPPGSGPGGAILAVMARACWTLVLPFSIANAGMWAWELPHRHRAQSVRAGIVRVYCALLTVLLTLAFASVAMDLLAVQCYGHGVMQCTALPDVLRVFEGWGDARRIAAYSAVPILVLVAVYIVSTVSRLRYSVAGRIAIEARALNESEPLLAQPRFWESRRETNRLALANIALGVGAVALLCGLAVWSADGSPWDERMLWGVAVVVVASAAMLVAAVVAFRTDSMPFERRPRPAAHKIPAGEIALLVALAAYAFGIVALLSHPDMLIGNVRMRAAFNVVLTCTVALAVALLIVTMFFRVSGRRYRAWHGFAPAVFLLLGLVVGLIWSSLVNVLVGDWLNGSPGAQALAATGSAAAASKAACSPSGCPPPLTLGAFYPWFLAFLLGALVVAVLFIAVALVRRRDVDPRVKEFVGGVSTATGAQADAARTVGARTDIEQLLSGERRRKRAAAARFHLVEPLLTVLCIGAGAAIIVTLVWSAFGALPAAAFDGIRPRVVAAVTRGFSLFIDAGLLAWAAIGLLVVAALVFGGSKTVRPLGIVWDLACFLPRAGHPLGAPCYTERAVPEVARRLSWWLDLDAAGDPPRRRSVVLVAHSMGAVVAVAALFMLRNFPRGAEYEKQVSLLTFGVQLRPYFGRFFPEILGPRVIDAVPCRAPRLWSRDPWARDLADASANAGGTAGDQVDEQPPPVGTTPTGVPVHEWVSLWRATDYLGFPARSTGRNSRDVFAEEVDASGYVGSVDTHSSYPRVPSYRSALGRLAGLPPRAPGRP